MEGKGEDTKGRMDNRKHNVSQSAGDVILTTCMTNLREEKIEKEVENIPSDGFYFLC